MRINYKLTIVSALALILIIFSSSPFSFSDGSNVTSIQFGFNAQQSSTMATCRLSSPVSSGDTLLITLDAAFIDRTTLNIGDSLHNTWTNFTARVNSASTWAKTYQARNIANGGSSDLITINYTDISGRGTYATTCAEFLGNINFTQITGIGTLTGIGCNTCNLTMVNTNTTGSISGNPPPPPHSVNYVSGWSEISTNPPAVFSLGYVGFGGTPMNPQTGSGSVQTISGSTAGIVSFHAESDIAQHINNNGTGVQIICSPSCIMSPAFVLTYTAQCISGGCATITSTITGFLVPNFVNGVSSLSWLYFLIVVLVPMAEIIGVITMDRQAVLDRHAIIFIFLALLLLDSIFGVMLNVVTVAMPFIFGTLFGIYLWRGRG